MNAAEKQNIAIPDPIKRELSFRKSLRSEKDPEAKHKILLVKNSKLRGYRSTTIGLAFDNYFITPHWFVYTSKNGSQYVLFEGTLPRPIKTDIDEEWILGGDMKVFFAFLGEDNFKIGKIEVADKELKAIKYVDILNIIFAPQI